MRGQMLDKLFLIFNGINTTISNYLSANKPALIKNKLIVTWFTPAKPINLELDSIINSVATKYTVRATTNIGLAHSLGETFDLTVSLDSEKIYFKFLRKQRHSKMRKLKHL